MTTQEIAAATSYGVPMPETCKELDWQGETLFCWVENTKGEIIIWQNSVFDYMLVASDKYGSNVIDKPKKLCNAPQMHEIVVRLPEKLVNYEGYESVDFCESNKKIGYGVINRFFSTEIENNHYAEAYAQMYLKLKEVKLI